MTPDWPYLTAGIPAIAGKIRTKLEDFQVEERLAYEPGGQGDHVFFGIEKRSLSTSRAIRDIARALGVQSKAIGAAGMKDARGVTRQTLSLEHVDPERIQDLQIPRLKVLWAKRHRNKLKIGHLKGNHFTIRIREVSENRERDIEQLLTTLETNGIPNYFGPQRFGNRGDTWEVGRYLLREEYEEAVQVIAGRPGEEDSGDVLRARELFAAGDYAQSIRAWPRGFNECVNLCKGMMRQNGNAKRAVLSLGRRPLALYVSAFQSWLFNRALARRIDQLGTLSAGDVAYKHENGAMFLVEDPAKEQGRADRFEISPTGPLYGGRMKEPHGAAAALETEVLKSGSVALSQFPQKGPLRCTGGRRVLRCKPEELTGGFGEDDLGSFYELKFFLPAGCYATALLREICKDKLQEHKGERRDGAG